MLSLRSFSRAAPRSVSRLVSQPRLIVRSPALFTPRILPSIARSRAPFSTTFARREGNEELVAKLAEEYDLEKDFREDEQSYNQTIKEYIEDSPFEIHDTPGQEDVVLTRKYNDEQIRVTFSIADMANSEAEQDSMEEDRAMYDDEEDISTAQSGGANTKGAVNRGRTSGGNIRVAPEDNIAPADRPELDDEDMDGEGTPVAQPFPARLSIKTTRDGQKGAMLIEAVCQDGEIHVDNVYYFADAAHAEPETPEQEWKRRTIYAGPPFGQLDEDLQILLEKYMEDRGINVKMAQFVPDYIDHKEQKEYLRWLKNMKTFLE